MWIEFYIPISQVLWNWCNLGKLNWAQIPQIIHSVTRKVIQSLQLLIQHQIMSYSYARVI